MIQTHLQKFRQIGAIQEYKISMQPNPRTKTGSDAKEKKKKSSIWPRTPRLKGAVILGSNN